MSEVTVDYIGFDAAQNACLMVLVEQGPWREPLAGPLSRLEDRIYGCMGAALDGHLADQIPASRGKPVVIRVDAHDLPKEDLDSFIHRLAEEASLLPDYSTDASPFVDRFIFEMNHDPAPDVPLIPEI